MHEYTGTSIDEAIEKAMQDLQMTRDVLDVEILEEKKSIFPRNRRVKIRVYVSDQLQYIPPSPSSDIQGSLEKETDFEHAIIDFIQGLMHKLHITAQVYITNRKDDDLFVEIESPEVSSLIGKRGAVFDALQVLIFSVARNLGNEKRVLIDMNKYRKTREQRLVQIAKKIFRQVKRNGGAIVLNPMFPWERLIIHQTINTLGDNISTISMGNEKNYIKQVKVFLDE